MDSSTLLMDQDAKALEAAKRGDPHELRVYLDHFDVDVNLKDDETQGTLLHVRLSRLTGLLLMPAVFYDGWEG